MLTNEIELHLADLLKKRLLSTLRNYGGYMILIVGEAGCGKSNTSVVLGEWLDNNFDISENKRNIALKLGEFMDMVNNKKDFPKGSVIILDEAGVGVSSRNWYDARQKALNFVFQTVRSRGLIIIMNTPDASFIDAQPRKLFRYIIETKKIDYKQNLVEARIFRSYINRQTGKPYWYDLVIKDSSEGLIRLKRIQVGTADKTHWNYYEKMKEVFNKILRQEVIEAIGKIEFESKNRPLSEDETR